MARVDQAGGLDMYHRVIEISDGTHVVMVLAVKLTPVSEAEEDALRGKGLSPNDNDVMLVDVQNQLCTTDPYQWPSLGSEFPRTLPLAHQFVIANFDRIPLGVVYRLDIASLLEADLNPGAGLSSSEDEP
jgi:hypothetical protein